ncbi:MAG: DNA mismatch repair protein MutS [Burkholderiaceae bacterium]|nr:DNA mismatch repair protein MutS [Burkholderiaceae bacterium]
MDALVATPTAAPQASGARLVQRAPPFESILFDGTDAAPAPGAEQPDCFHDLGLDQIVEAVAARCKDYDLTGYFHAPLPTEDAVVYRQQVMRDLEQPAVMAAIGGFTQRLRALRQQLPLATKPDNVHERNRWHLDAVQVYGEAVETLRRELTPLSLHSRGLQRWREYIVAYAGSPAFTRPQEHARRVVASLAAVRYAMTIDQGTVVVRRYNGEPDYSAEVERTFAKFRRGAVTDYLVKLPVRGGLNHIEAQVLDCVARLHPDAFGALAAFRAEHEQFLDERIVRFDREIHFYLGWLEFIAPLRSSGLSFCYPRVSASSKAVAASDAFDLALARRLRTEARSVVCNDFELHDGERLFVVTGPNQGGKTTFARMFGQLHWLAALGCAVPGSQAKLFLFDRLFSHFEREEDIRNLRGKLHDDLVRMHDIVQRATPSSLVVINEIFSSTTLHDALSLGRRMLARLVALDLLAVCVTFLDELASFDPKVVSLVAAIDPQDPTARSFKLERRPADGLAHALAIAEKYRVTEAWLKRRIAS